MTKRVRVQLVGTGQEGDSYRVNLPTYRIVDVDYGAMRAIVDVPDDCYPPAPVGKREKIRKDAKLGPVVVDVTLEHAIDAANWYDEKYREHVSKYGLDVK